MHRFLSLCVVALLLAGIAVVSSGGATHANAGWVMTDLSERGVPKPLVPWDVNDRGQIVLNDETNGKAFIWRRGTLRPLWRDEDGEAMAINDSGQVVGSLYKEKADRVEAFLWEKGRMRRVGLSRRNALVTAYGINDRGVVVGSVEPPGLGLVGSYPFLWRHGRRVTNLGKLPGKVVGGTQSEANAINNRGQVVGSSDTRMREWPRWMDREHAFLWQDGAMLDLSLRPEGENGAWAINERGQIVGWRGDRVATLWEGGESIRLATLAGGRQSDAYDISENGTVVGWSYYGKSTYWHAVVWQDSQVTSLCPIRRLDSMAHGINDRGTMIVGRCDGRPVLWTLKRG